MAKVALYRIREVDGQDDEVSDALADLHRLTFFGGAPIPRFDWGYWWLAYREATPVAFAGVVPSTHVRSAGYICRVGVLKPHCGRSLQLRLMRTMELRALRNGWSCMVSDTTQNIASANNFIRAGYRLYQATISMGVSGHAVLAQIRRVRLLPSWHPSKKAVTPSIPMALLFWAEGKGLYMVQPRLESPSRCQGSASTAANRSREGTSRL